jgi:hypothetical protein
MFIDPCSSIYVHRSMLITERLPEEKGPQGLKPHVPWL